MRAVNADSTSPPAPAKRPRIGRIFRAHAPSAAFSVLAAFLSTFLAAGAANAMGFEDIARQCPDMARRPGCEEGIRAAALSLDAALLQRHGCDVLPVWHAFFFDDATIMPDRLKDNEDGLAELVRLMKAVPALADALHHNKKLASGLAARLDKEEEDPDAWLRSLELAAGHAEALGAASSADAPHLLLNVLVPGLPPVRELKRDLSPSQAKPLSGMLAWSAVGSDDEHLPFLAEHPRDTLRIRKEIIREWGEGALTSLLERSPEAMAAIRPPMTWKELADGFRWHPSPSEFAAMQRHFIRVQRGLHLAVREEHGSARAAEACTAFADHLSIALTSGDMMSIHEKLGFSLKWLLTGMAIPSRRTTPTRRRTRRSFRPSGWWRISAPSCRR